MNRAFVRTAVATVATVPLLLSAAGLAAAAPSDVTLVASSTGSGITIDVDNNSTAPIRCGALIFDGPYSIVDVSNQVSNVGLILLPSGEDASVQATYTNGSTQFPDGNYTIEWFCITDVQVIEDFENWGTPLPTEDGDLEGLTPTTTPQTVVVDSTIVPPSTCSGSVCLPTGSAF